MEFSRVVSSASADLRVEPSKRRRHTSKLAQHHYIRQWQQSGLSQASFCKQHDLHPKSLSRWIKQSELVEPISTKMIDTTESIAAQLSIEHLELKLSNGASIHFSGVLQGSWISAMLQEVCLCKLS